MSLTKIGGITIDDCTFIEQNIIYFIQGNKEALYCFYVVSMPSNCGV